MSYGCNSDAVVRGDLISAGLVADEETFDELVRLRREDESSYLWALDRLADEQRPEEAR